MRIAAGGARLLLGCDLVVSASAEALSKLQPGHSRAIVNSHETITGDFTRNPDLAFPEPRPAPQRSPTRPARAAPSSSTRPGSRPACSAIRSRPICSCSAMPISGGWCRCRPRRSSGRSSSTASRSTSTAAPFAGAGAPRSIRPLVEARAAPPDAAPESHRLSETLDEIDRAPRRLPDRIPERRLCRALCRPDRPSPRRRGGRRSPAARR